MRIVPKFKEYDRDGNGYITLEEASYILQNPPFDFPAGKVITLLKKFDKDGNGKLDIEEFSDFYAEAKATYVCFVIVYRNLQIYLIHVYSCIAIKFCRAPLAASHSKALS